MKTLLTFCGLLLGTVALAQTSRTTEFRDLSTSINDDDGRSLSIQINGQRADGSRITYDRTFNVVGLSKAQRDALADRVLDSLGIHVPEPPKPPMPPSPVELEGETVTFVCPTCTGKMELLVRGENFTATRTADSRKDKEPTFPFTVKIPPGRYRYQYTQNRVLQMELPFTVKAGQDNVVTVK